MPWWGAESSLSRQHPAHGADDLFSIWQHRLSSWSLTGAEGAWKAVASVRIPAGHRQDLLLCTQLRVSWDLLLRWWTGRTKFALSSTYGMGSFLQKGVSNPRSTGRVDLSFYTALLRTLYCKRKRMCTCVCIHMCAGTHACVYCWRWQQGRKQQDQEPASYKQLKSSSCWNPAGEMGFTLHTSCMYHSSEGVKWDFLLHGGNTMLQTPYTHADTLFTS